MAVVRADGTPITSAGDLAAHTFVPDDPMTVITERVYLERPIPGRAGLDRRLLWRQGQVVTQSEIDAAFTPAPGEEEQDDGGDDGGDGDSTVTATLNARYQGSPEAGWLIDADVAATGTPRPVTLRLPDIGTSIDVQADVNAEGNGDGTATLAADLTALPDLGGAVDYELTLRVTDINGPLDHPLQAGHFYSDLGAFDVSAPATVRLLVPSDPDIFDEGTMTFTGPGNSAATVSLTVAVPGGPDVPTTFPLTTGDTNIGIAQVTGDTVTARLTDTGSHLFDEQDLSFTAGQDNGPFTFTIELA